MNFRRIHGRSLPGSFAHSLWHCLQRECQSPWVGPWGLAILEKYDPAKVTEELKVAEEWLQAFELPPEPPRVEPVPPKPVGPSADSRKERGREKAIKALMKHFDYSREKAEAVVEAVYSLASKK